MAASITIPLSITNSHLIEGARGLVLVDAGRHGREKVFFSALEKAGFEPGDVKLIVITHAHYDHVGSLAAIKKGCGDPPVMISPIAGEILAAGRIVLPPGLTPVGKLMSRLSPLMPESVTRFEPLAAELVVAEETSLAPWGLAGKVIPTPGHTAGSISLILDNGEAYVGDLAFNPLPLGLGPIFPPFGDDPAALLASWERVLAAGARTIHPAHGDAFPADRLRAQLSRRKAKTRTA